MHSAVMRHYRRSVTCVRARERLIVRCTRLVLLTGAPLLLDEGYRHAVPQQWGIESPLKSRILYLDACKGFGCKVRQWRGGGYAAHETSGSTISDRSVSTDFDHDP